MNKEIYNDISFADAEFIDYSFNVNSGVLKINIEAWDGEIIKIEFEETIGVKSYGGKMIAGLFEEVLEDNFLEEAVKMTYDPGVAIEFLEKHPFNCYKFIDNNGSVLLEVVAKKINLKKGIKK